jgi:hypothetical protein
VNLSLLWLEAAGTGQRSQQTQAGKGQMNDLALFTMGALDLATGKLRTPPRTVVRKYKGEPKPENLVETKATRTEDDDEALKAIREGRTRPPDRSRVTEPARFNPGLLFVPRPCVVSKDQSPITTHPISRARPCRR